jgi:hypothetical protein
MLVNLGRRYLGRNSEGTYFAYKNECLKRFRLETSQSEVPSKANSEISGCKNVGDTSSNSTKCWQKDCGNRWQASLTFEERLALSEELRAKSNNWKHQKLRSIPIPKKDGSTRLLKIPTIADRAWQCLAKYALEPAHEATFHATELWIRTGRSAHDAQKFSS